MVEKELIPVIAALVGACIGSVSSLGGTYLNSRYALKQKVLENQLLHFREIASVIVVSKRIFEEELAKLAQAQLKSIETNTEMSQTTFLDSLTVLESQREIVYGLQIHLYAVPQSVSKSIQDLQAAVAKSASPVQLFDKSQFDEFIKAFDRVLISMGTAIGNKKAFSIQNPWVLAHRQFQD